ncbi:hypothetical protein HDV05_006043 [Chytridiales sp. JEL 0842]|nr:hypothetical protein HDV05_006043 [Chytridiales sp. JEL 0842]
MITLGGSALMQRRGTTSKHIISIGKTIDGLSSASAHYTTSADHTSTSSSATSVSPEPFTNPPPTKPTSPTTSLQHPSSSSSSIFQTTFKPTPPNPFAKNRSSSFSDLQTFHQSLLNLDRAFETAFPRTPSTDPSLSLLAATSILNLSTLDFLLKRQDLGYLTEERVWKLYKLVLFWPTQTHEMSVETFNLVLGHLLGPYIDAMPRNHNLPLDSMPLLPLEKPPTRIPESVQTKAREIFADMQTLQIPMDATANSYLLLLHQHDKPFLKHIWETQLSTTSPKPSLEHWAYPILITAFSPPPPTTTTTTTTKKIITHQQPPLTSNANDTFKPTFHLLWSVYTHLKSTRTPLTVSHIESLLGAFCRFQPLPVKHLKRLLSKLQSQPVYHTHHTTHWRSATFEALLEASAVLGDESLHNRLLTRLRNSRRTPKKTPKGVMNKILQFRYLNSTPQSVVKTYIKHHRSKQTTTSNNNNNANAETYTYLLPSLLHLPQTDLQTLPNIETLLPLPSSMLEEANLGPEIWDLLIQTYAHLSMHDSILSAFETLLSLIETWKSNNVFGFASSSLKEKDNDDTWAWAGVVLGDGVLEGMLGTLGYVFGGSRVLLERGEEEVKKEVVGWCEMYMLTEPSVKIRYERFSEMEEDGCGGGPFDVFYAKLIECWLLAGGTRDSLESILKEIRETEIKVLEKVRRKQ